MIAGIQTRNLTSNDREYISIALELLNRTQGRGLFGSTYLHDRFENPDDLVVAAFRGAELVGVGAVKITRSLDYFCPFSPDLPKELDGKRVASFDTLSVSEAFQGHGIGQLLCQRRLEWAIVQKCDVALGVSWVSGLIHTFNRTFEKSGFRAVKKIEDFYKKGSLEKSFDCPGCHLIPCTCSAVLYWRDFY